MTISASPSQMDEETVRSIMSKVFGVEGAEIPIPPDVMAGMMKMSPDALQRMFVKWGTEASARLEAAGLDLRKQAKKVFAKSARQEMGTVVEGRELPWVAEAIRRYRAFVLSGAKRACPHVGLPAKIVVEAWNPEGAMCGECYIARGEVILSDEEDNTCDGCGHVGDHHIHSASAVAGNLLLYGGLCCDCLVGQGGVPCLDRERELAARMDAERHAAERIKNERRIQSVAEAVAAVLRADGDERIEALHRLRAVAVEAGDDYWAIWSKQQLRKVRSR